MIHWSEHPCENGHAGYIPTDDPLRWECEVCGTGFWPPEDIECDLDAYAHALGMTHEISGGGPSGTTLPVRMVSEEISEPLSLSGMKHRAERPPTRSNCSSVAPPRSGEQARRRGDGLTQLSPLRANHQP